VPLLNVYGLTETTITSSLYQMNGMKEGGTEVTIERPVANTQVYVLDCDMRVTPIGVPGELYIGGAGVSRGYISRAEETAERFMPNPYSEKGGGRLYRTGDKGRRLAFGGIELLGRIDQQVKIRGFRIELGEIEARLVEHPAVREAVVVAREETADDKRLVAYYTPEPGTLSADTAETMARALREYVSAALPEYMTPAAYVMLEALPLTANGKLDRKALPAPEMDAYAAGGYEAPVGEIETTLAEIWADALKLERVGRHDNFFELGGHSLLAIRLIERMRRAGLHADVRALFTTATVAALAAESYSAWERDYHAGDVAAGGIERGRDRARR
jgi:aryl carrier-like protein